MNGSINDKIPKFKFQTNAKWQNLNFEFSVVQACFG